MATGTTGVFQTTQATGTTTFNGSNSAQVGLASQKLNFVSAATVSQSGGSVSISNADDPSYNGNYSATLLNNLPVGVQTNTTRNYYRVESVEAGGVS